MRCAAMSLTYRLKYPTNPLRAPTEKCSMVPEPPHPALDGLNPLKESCAPTRRLAPEIVAVVLRDRTR